MTLPPFVHIGDLHLGPGERNAQRRAALDKVVIGASQAGGRAVSGWLLPGDLNHARMTIEDRNYLAGILTAMAESAPVVICYGNHDLEGDLDIFTRLDTPYQIYVVDRPQTLTLETPSLRREVVVAVLPYPTKGGLVAHGIRRELQTSEAAKILELTMAGFAEDLRAADAAGHITLFLSHINVGGSILSTGQPNIGREIELAPHLFDAFPAATYIGANHIHRGQTVGRLWYPGSICRLDWGECEPKRYLEVTFADGSWAGHAGDGPENGRPDGWVYDVAVIPIDVPAMYHVEGTLTPDGFDWSLKRSADVVENLPIPASWAGAEVRVRYRVDADVRSALDADAIIRPIFAGAATLVLEPIVMRTREIRAPEVVEAESLTEKAQAFAAQPNGRPWTPTLGEKLDILQDPDDRAFDAWVAAQLAPIAAVEEEEATELL